MDCERCGYYILGECHLQCREESKENEKNV